MMGSDKLALINLLRMVPGVHLVFVFMYVCTGLDGNHTVVANRLQYLRDADYGHDRTTEDFSSNEPNNFIIRHEQTPAVSK